MRLISWIKRVIAVIIERYQIYQCNRFSESREKNLIKVNSVSFDKKRKNDCEKAWADYWFPLVKVRSKWAYRLYSHYCGHTLNILSQPIADELNNALNPIDLLPLYEDKNIFDRVLPYGILPKTILRVVDGVVMDDEYNAIEDFSDITLKAILEPYEGVVIKPTRGSDSGRGVLTVDLRNGFDQNLRASDICGFGRNLIIQEKLRQHSFMSQFNPSSVNTLRISTYKSPYSGKVQIISAVIRMGAQGLNVDNLHQGGRMVGVDIGTGVLSNCCFDADGVKYRCHNGIDFSKDKMNVPDWQRVSRFAKDVAVAVPHLRLLQLDIVLDSDGHPRLLEYNASGFSMWIAQFTGTPALGDFTDEARRYALSLKRSIEIKLKREI